jgi:hypothetical protein
LGLQYSTLSEDGNVSGIEIEAGSEQKIRHSINYSLSRKMRRVMNRKFVIRKVIGLIYVDYILSSVCSRNVMSLCLPTGSSVAGSVEFCQIYSRRMKINHSNYELLGCSTEYSSG